MIRTFILSVSTTILCLFAGTSISNQTSEANDSASETAAAEPYAKEFHISVQEAIIRLRLQDESVAAVGRLREEFEPRLAGLYFQHEPDFKIILRLTGSRAIKERHLALPSGRLKVSFIVGAGATYKELLASVREHRKKLRAMLPELESVSVDQRTGNIVVRIHASNAKTSVYEREKPALEELFGHPVKIEFVSAREQELGKLRGGGNMLLNSTYQCTAGFIVSDTSGGRGVVTAAHCGNFSGIYYNNEQSTSQQYVLADVATPQAQDRFYNGTKDFQVHRLAPGSAHEFGLGFYGVSATKVTSVTARRSRSSTEVGQVVCLRGLITGYSCGQVVDTNYPSASCGSVSCEDTWVLVQGADLRCDEGDSGGPVFRYTQAYGIVKSRLVSGGNCTGMIYMSVDYLTEQGYLIFSGA